VLIVYRTSVLMASVVLYYWVQRSCVLQKWTVPLVSGPTSAQIINHCSGYENIAGCFKNKRWNPPSLHML
jgi:hypothetical protein